MAFSEIYCTHNAGGGGIGTEGDPYTLAEGLTNGGAGVRLNVLSSGAYSLGADTVAAGAATGLSVVRGYNSTIGDLEGLGRNANGTLNTTNFPAITLTGILVPGAFSVLQNLNITGALSSRLVGGTTNDNWGVVGCRIENTQNNASAECFEADNTSYVVNSDIICSGAAHGLVCRVDVDGFLHDVRIEGIANSTLLQILTGTVSHCVLVGNNTGIGIAIGLATAQTAIINTTLYDLATAITMTASAFTSTPLIISCHATDCAKYIDNLYAGTANAVVIEVNNRTRENTTPRTGLGEAINIGEITGGVGEAVDYTDAPNDDLTLITGAAGENAALVANLDCGGNRHADPAGGGGGVGPGRSFSRGWANG